MASKVMFLGFAAVLIAVVLATSTNGVAADGCDLQGLITQCAQYVLKTGPQMPPSQGCCDVIQKADIACVCQHITPEIQTIVSIEKVFYVAQFCHKDLPRGTKCGSVTIPPAMKRN
ncbi:hypothetical protein MKW94_003950 [Papaver nudicaule]|uniref:Bifunctional inhibitor/plant lipid transfer protein/seed storage helical domain-containing protein n=1 Tax=Papaver nudicaule TaxID=74823 RepID=A0AA41VZ18_PAPNU|nr:hypothetical protein [Papaver nudicaule]